VVASAIGAAVGIAGVGHVYLREWRRAAAWFALVVGSALVLGAVFVDPGADPANLSPESIPETVTLPIAALLLPSMLDAYLVASRSTPDDEESTGPACPHCGKELDGDLDFCPWCTTRLEAVDADGADATSR